MTHAIPTKAASVKMDGDKAVNAETGETLGSQLGAGHIHVRGESKSAILTSDEYVIIDSNALTYVNKHFTPVDIGRILKIANMTYGPYNIIHKNGTPITDAQMMEELNYSRNKYADFMKRLYKKSIVYYMSGMVEGKDVTYIMLNPYLARKRKVLHQDALSVFDNISKL